MSFDLRVLGWANGLLPLRGRWLLYALIAVMTAAVVAGAFTGDSSVTPPLDWRPPFDVKTWDYL